MTRKVLILAAALTLSACATLPTASDLQQIADGIMTGVRTAKFAYCSSDPKTQAGILRIVRKAFPAVVITCQGVQGEPVVVLGERR